MTDEQYGKPLHDTAAATGGISHAEGLGAGWHPDLRCPKLDREPLDLQTAGRSAPRGARAFLWLTMLVALAVAVGVLVKAWNRDQEKANESDLEAEHSGIANRLKAPKVERPAPHLKREAMPPTQAPARSYYVPPPVPAAPSPVDDVTQRRLTSPLQAGAGAGGDPASGQAKAGGPLADAGPLADKLRPLELAPSVAGQLGNRNFLLTQGTMIDCTLQTKLVSAQAGLLTCLATHDVMSANGKVKLIDAGTKFTGYQSGGIQQGQARAFITWNRLETPTGVIVNLGSPGTGPLGEAGVDGHIDNHFWDRFGNAILLSLIGDFGDWAANQGQSGNNNIRFDNTREGGQDVAAKILEKSLDIPPTLYKNQGERIGIMVARDLDFSQVYDLEPIP
ncbi:type IV secretion system protein VirB10 [Candidimonas nitroreducens]|jgi:type IV secretion system protein VirB10|uniref:Type VI secretion protein n=1 Tax=Candidimonas nitroreducens TaxID=683354 RepID=A0A225MWU3_9BURK|nr:type IV secretion system protein VirB10 [Candidimonas nitroreducens]OWT65542.1 type VI secretion protein [Candidimonas nitroreducens]